MRKKSRSRARHGSDGNEPEVGEGIAEAIRLGLVTRAELWVTRAVEHVPVLWVLWVL